VTRPGSRRVWRRLRTLDAPGTDVFAVAVGGVLGSAARLGVSEAIVTSPGGFPWATFLVNVTGCVALGLVARRVGGVARAFLVTGVLGGYTTFSAFAVEADRLVVDGHVLTAIVYVVASVGIGVAVART
jgi:CrcB protein